MGQPEGGSFCDTDLPPESESALRANMTWYNYAQYENKSETIGWQSRLQWIIKPGKEVFLTFNSPLIDPLERSSPEIYEARVKVKYTIRF